MAARGLPFHPRAVVNETLKISAEKALKLFVEDESMTEYSFPSSLTNEERKYIHQNAPKLGLTTCSHGRAPARFITVYKKKEEALRAPREATIDITSFSHQIMSKLLVENPLSEKERKELLPYNEKQTFDKNKPGCSGMPGTNSQTDGKEKACTTGRLNNIIPQIPRAIDPRTISPEIIMTRASLPIAEYRESIVFAISQNPVILISGDTGCGKTTQVPQFILEDCAERMVPCRILVAEPRRLAALSVAERVASERGEQVGQSVGFQIRLESKVSPRTLLTYCTNGVLLRTLMGNEQSLKSVTHIVVDEVHERDRMCDLLITVMREMVHRGANFKLIIMSATFDTERFVNYFNGCPVVKIPGKMYDVNYHFLEDILKLTGYKSEQMAKFKKRMGETYQNQKRELLKWCPEGREQPDLLVLPGDEAISNATSSSYSTGLVGEESNDDDQQEFDIPEDVKEQVNDLLKAAWCDPSQEVFENILSLYINEGVPVDYRHPETGVTALLVTTCRGVKDFVESFLDLGANVSIRTALNDWNCIEWAKHFGYDEIVQMLSLHVNEDKEREADEIVQAKELSQEDKQLLEAYHRTFDDDAVDLELILCLIHYICINGRDDPKGAILVFLPGYDEIVTLRQLIINDFNKLHYGQYVCFTLHSQMQSSDHRRVFRPVPAGTRKIILSTNIAETSVTIDDVVYVIDSGKVKEKSYDAVTGVTSMKSVRISQANAVQRKGRAGRVRPGVCYHLFSSYRFQNMEKYQVPEIVRMSAHELCLQSKLLAPNRPLVEFLSKLPDPPSQISIKNSIKLLTAIDALDPNENLTELGFLLLDLPIEPHLGKIILHSVVLKCLDPILTIVCSITYKDPFLIPSNPRQKHLANEAKEKLSSDSLSDHMVLLKAFQGWQKAKKDNFEVQFCQQNFISASTMEVIFGLRTQLLGQLRASGFVRARGPNDIRDLNTNSENWAVVKAALAAGYYPNVLRLNKNAKRARLFSRIESRVSFHPSSVLSMGGYLSVLKGSKSEWFVYEELARIGIAPYARMCTPVSPLAIAIFGGPCRLPKSNFTFDSRILAEDEGDSDDESHQEPYSIIKIDDWLSFKMKPEVASLLWQLRQKWQALFLRRMMSPNRQPPQSDCLVIKNLTDILFNEEQRLGLAQPIGVGQRPIPMVTSYCSPVADSPSTLQQLQSPYQIGLRYPPFRMGGYGNRSPREK